MEMLRLVIAEFDSQPRQLVENLRASTPVTTLSTFNDDGRFLMLVGATIQLSMQPKIDARNVLNVPREHADAEKAVERAVDALASAERLRRQLSSPRPCVAFRTNVQKQLRRLMKVSNVGNASFRLPHYISTIDPALIAQLESDRQDGVALISEANSTPHATGKLHELFRLFERAFKMDCERLSNPLLAYLIQGWATRGVKSKIGSTCGGLPLTQIAGQHLRSNGIRSRSSTAWNRQPTMYC